MRASTTVVSVMLLSTSACSYQLYSPPARLVPLESARTVPAGTTSVTARTSMSAAVFDPALGVLSGGVKHGLTDHLELDGDLSYARLFQSEDHDVDPNVGAARVGLKGSTGDHNLAWMAGVGGGLAPAAGAFFATDVGAVASYQNCYAVPFFAGQAFLSAPAGAHDVTFANGHRSKPVLTAGYGLGTGLEMPLTPSRCRSGENVPRLQVGLSVNVFHRTNDDATTSASNGTDQAGDTTYGAVGLGVGLSFPL